MDFTKFPEKDTIGYLILAATVGALAASFGRKIFDTFVDRILWPFRLLASALYRWIAPRNPFSISIRAYRKNLLRSNLSRMENPCGPDDLEVPLEHAFAPLKLKSSASQNAVDLFDYISSKHRCLVLGGPGTGKTTLMKSLVIGIAKRACRADLRDLIPVFVVLRNLARKEMSVEQAIVAALSDHHFPGAENFVTSALASGKMLIVLDGLDEVGASRAAVVEKIVEFCNKDVQRASPNRLLVTCREHSYRTADLRDVISAVLQVEPFSSHHMRVFLEGWPSYQGRLAINLYAIIQDDSGLRDICRNPLLLTILTGLYLAADNFQVPSSRDKFYISAVDELLISRPARRQISQQFASEDKRQILERVALERLETVDAQEDPEEFTRSAIYEKAELVLKSDKIDLQRLVDELVDVNGILKPVQDGSYTCAHRTILEYFAAREAARTRKVEDVVAAFSERPELTEVLYFYCGLLRNLPALDVVLGQFVRQQRWRDAGRSMMFMADVPSAVIVKQVSEQLFGAVLEQNGSESIEILSSLASRQDMKFDDARVYFSKSIEYLTQKSGNDAGASALEVAVAASPEVAMKLIPGLLKHPSERWRKVGVQLLRDVGLDEALDKLIKLLGDKDGVIRGSVGLILAEMILSRNVALRQRRNLFPERRDRSVWPLEKYFPGAIAIPIAEAVAASGEVSKSVAVNAAAKVINIKSARQPDDGFTWLWRRVPLDVAADRIRRITARATLKVAVVLACIWAGVLVVGDLLQFYTGSLVVLSIGQRPLTIIQADHINEMAANVQKALGEVESIYPGSTDSSLARGFQHIARMFGGPHVEADRPDWVVAEVADLRQIGMFGGVSKQVRGAIGEHIVSLISPATVQALKKSVAEVMSLQDQIPAGFSISFVPRGSDGYVRRLSELLAFSFLAFSLLQRIRERKKTKRYSDKFLQLHTDSFDYFSIALFATTFSLVLAEPVFVPSVLLFSMFLLGVILPFVPFPRNPLASAVREVQGLKLEGH